MKKIIVFLVILIIISATYLIWPTKENAENLVVPIKKKDIPEISKKIDPILPPEEIKVQKPKTFSRLDKIKYFKKIEDTIKEQWKELEECESEFDLQFGELMAMRPDEQLEYLKDPNNLEIFLEKISTFNMTTPSSGKMIKELADPIASEVDGKEVLKTVGYVKTCRDVGKSILLSMIHNLKVKNKDTAQAALTFFENENSTLTYPYILYNQMYDIKVLLADYKMDESRYPEIIQITNKFNEYQKKLNKISKGFTLEENGLFNPKVQKEDYEFAKKLQREIGFLIKKIKSDLKE